jgi:hypothetical protein
MNFGPGGRVATRVPGLAEPSALFFDSQGGLISLHSFVDTADDRSGLVLARYLLRN